jgi:hypothetical protein
MVKGPSMKVGKRTAASARATSAAGKKKSAKTSETADEVQVKMEQL